MAIVKAKYLECEDKDTRQTVQVQMIPPQPEGDDLGGITLEEKENIEKSLTLDVEVTQDVTQITSTYTFNQMLEEYSKGRDIRVRFTSNNFSGKEIIMHNVGHSATKIEFHSILELNNRLIFLELECGNDDEWDLYSKQYIQTDSYYDAVQDGAAAHNSLYRGKNLGTSVEAEQYARIVDGTFRGMFVGDYWTLNGTKYVIAEFDYMYNIGDTALNKHHIMIVPERPLYSHNMNETNTTAGGYVESSMYKEGLAQALTKIKTDFGESHIIQYRNLLTNAVDSNGKASNWGWYDRQLDIMNESMVYGHIAFGDGRYNVGCQKNQLALFRLSNVFASISRSWYWLRDVVSSTDFANVNADGHANYNGASTVFSVLPAFLIG